MKFISVIKKFFFICVLFFLPMMLCACQKQQHIVTSTGGLGHQADNLEKMVKTGKVPSSHKSTYNVIYLGRDYENNTFGPPRLKFVFEK